MAQGLEGTHPTMRFVLPGKGRVLKMQILAQDPGYVSHFTRLDTPRGQAGVGGRGRLPNAFRQIIDFAQGARLPAAHGPRLR